MKAMTGIIAFRGRTAMMLQEVKVRCRGEEEEQREEAGEGGGGLAGGRLPSEHQAQHLGVWGLSPAAELDFVRVSGRGCGFKLACFLAFGWRRYKSLSCSIINANLFIGCRYKCWWDASRFDFPSHVRHTSAVYKSWALRSLQLPGRHLVQPTRTENSSKPHL